MLKCKLKEISFFILLGLCYCFLVKCLLKTSNMILIRFLLVQCIVVFLPGYALAKTIKFSGTVIENLAFGYAIGYVFNIIEYLIIYGMGLQKFAVIFSILTAIGATVLLIKLRGKEENNVIVDKDWFSILLVFSFYLLINIIVYSGNAITPFRGQGILDIHRDMQFWCSNAVSLKHGFRPEAVYFDDSILYYHYFSSAQIALISQVSGIDVFTLAVELFPFTRCILLVGGLVFLLNIFNTEKYKIFYISVILFMTGFENISIVTYIGHMVEAPFGFDIGFSIGIWCMAILLLQCLKQEIDWKLFFLWLFFWGVECGLKGPIAAVLIFIPALICIQWLVSKQYKKLLIYGMATLSTFLIVSDFVVGAFRFLNHTTTEGTGRMRFYTITEILLKSTFRGDLHSKILNLIMSFASDVFCTHPVLTILSAINFVLLISLLLKKKIKFDEAYLDVTFLATALIGLFLGIVYDAGGKSEMYFSMASFIPGIIFNIFTISLYLKYTNFMPYRISAFNYCGNIFIVVLMLFGCYLFLVHGYDGAILKALGNGRCKINSDWDYTSNGGGNYFTRNEALACKWIRENTDMNSIIISDKNIKNFADEELGYSTYYTGVFTERQQYIEAIDLVNVIEMKEKKGSNNVINEMNNRKKLVCDMYNNDLVAFNKIKEHGVNYIVQNETYTPQFSANGKDIELVCQFGKVCVYKFQ